MKQIGVIWVIERRHKVLSIETDKMNSWKSVVAVFLLNSLLVMAFYISVHPNPLVPFFSFFADNNQLSEYHARF